MQTITFYSYKGGTGRSLALANAAVYLARLGFSVVALDFDLEAPGLHYKFSRNDDGTPLAVTKGVVDYVNAFILDGRVPSPLKDFVLTATVPGVDKPLVHLMPAGQAPSIDYWLKLSRIDWHNLFYSKGAKGVQVFMELKTQILDDFAPDYLLIDARTGITEMGGVATTLLADTVICLVLPTAENLTGARAVLQSLKRSRRDSGAADPEIIVAVSRLPKMKGSEDERELTDRILAEMNQEAEDLKDTLSCRSVFVLHSEAALQVREMLRVGSGMDPDESVLLRDYLRLFATFVPKEAIEPKVHDLIEKAWEKLRYDPDAAVKDMEEYAESFGHPETYRELLRFYQVRNVAAASILRRAQRLWEITRDSRDPYLWEVLNKYFEPTRTYPRKPNEWSPNLDFMRELWRDAGERDPEFGVKLAEQYNTEDIESGAADVLLEIINSADPSSRVVTFCIQMLDIAKRSEEADGIITRHKARLGSEPDFAAAWARHALRTNNKAAVSEITKLPAISTLRPSLAGLLYFRVGSTEQAAALAERILGEASEREIPSRDLEELGELFRGLGRSEEFEKAIKRGYPADVIQNLRERPTRLRRR